MKRGDVVIEINGEKVKDVDWFVQKVRTLSPGSTVNLKIIRRKREHTLRIKLDERPNTADGRVKENDLKSGKSDQKGSEALKDFGIEEVLTLNNSLRRKYKIDSKTDGLIISKVSRDSLAAAQGIREGDLLQEVNGFEVKTPEDISKAVDKNDKALIIMIEREGSTFIVQVTKSE